MALFTSWSELRSLWIQARSCQARKAKRRKIDGPLYLEAVDLALHETSHPGSVASSDRPIKITATNESVFSENQLVKKKAMVLQA